MEQDLDDVQTIRMAHSYDVGTRAWQPDATEGWISSEVEQKTVEGDKVKLVFLLANGEVLRLDDYFTPIRNMLTYWVNRPRRLKPRRQLFRAMDTIPYLL